MPRQKLVRQILGSRRNIQSYRLISTKLEIFDSSGSSEESTSFLCIRSRPTFPPPSQKNNNNPIHQPSSITQTASTRSTVVQSVHFCATAILSSVIVINITPTTKPATSDEHTTSHTVCRPTADLLREVFEGEEGVGRRLALQRGWNTSQHLAHKLRLAVVSRHVQRRQARLPNKTRSQDFF